MKPIELEAAVLIALRDSDANGFPIRGALPAEDLAAAVGTPVAEDLLDRMRKKGLIDYYVDDGGISAVWTT